MTLPALISIAVESVNADRQPDLRVLGSVFSTAGQVLGATTEFKINESAIGPDAGVSPEPGTAHAYHFTADLDVSWRTVEVEGKPAVNVATIRLRYGVTYQLGIDEPGWAPGDMGEFLNQNLQFQVWPYMREMVSSLVSRMNLPPSPLNRCRLWASTCQGRGSST